MSDNTFKTDIITNGKINAAKYYFDLILEEVSNAQEVSIPHIGIEEGEILHRAFAELKENPEDENSTKIAVLRLNKSGDLKIILTQMIDSRGHIGGGILHVIYDAMQTDEVKKLLVIYFKVEFDYFINYELRYLADSMKTYNYEMEI